MASVRGFLPVRAGSLRAVKCQSEHQKSNAHCLTNNRFAIGDGFPSGQTLKLDRQIPGSKPSTSIASSRSPQLCALSHAPTRANLAHIFEIAAFLVREEQRRDKAVALQSVAASRDPAALRNILWPAGVVQAEPH